MHYCLHSLPQGLWDTPFIGGSEMSGYATCIHSLMLNSVTTNTEQSQLRGYNKATRLQQATYHIDNRRCPTAANACHVQQQDRFKVSWQHATHSDGVPIHLRTYSRVIVAIQAKIKCLRSWWYNSCCKCRHTSLRNVFYKYNPRPGTLLYII